LPLTISTTMADDTLLQSLRSRLPDEFSRDALNSALQVLDQPENKMRAHQFAGTLRELIAHILSVMAPTEAVTRCAWYKQEKDVEGPTRRQRALYTCRGGLSDAFLKDKLKLNPKNLHREFSNSFQQLNKRTHVRPDTVLADPDKIEEFANDGISALLDVFETMDEVHKSITDAIVKELHGEAMSAFINETIQELDEIAGRYETGSVWVDEAKVIFLGADTIEYQVKGSVDVTLHYGGRSNPTEIDESFPYECTTTAPALDPTRFDSSQTTMTVDTSSWRQ